MKIGLIARDDNTGLGNQTYEFFRHIDCHRVLVAHPPSPKTLERHPERFSATRPGTSPFPEVAIMELPVRQREVLTDFLDGLDIVYTAETAYDTEFYAMARRMNVKTVEHVNWELFAKHSPDRRPDLYAMPTTWHLNGMPAPVELLRVPVPSSPWHTTAKSATRLLHIAGYPAAGDRNGTRDLVHALRYVNVDVEVTIKCQGGMTLHPPSGLPSNVDLRLQLADVEDYWNLYRDHDVLLMPRRYGGLCLPMQEALACGMPVIMTGVEPNSNILPLDWLVPPVRGLPLRLRNPVQTYHAHHQFLAAKINAMANNPEWYSEAVLHAHRIAEMLSWKTQKENYLDLFERVLQL